MKKISIFLILAASFICNIALAQQSPNTSQSSWALPAQNISVHHGTGVRPPTKQEIAKIETTHKRIHKVHLNRLGWQRANEYRKANNLPTLGEDAIAPQGQETESAIDTSDMNLSNTAIYSNMSLADETLPASVDNSNTIWFPPIGDQGGLGSCVSFATTYYQLSYAEAKLHNWNISTTPINYSEVFSPKWTYNMVNNGVNDGQGVYDPFVLLQGSGAPTWTLFPYDGSDFTSWPTTSNIWLNALSQRIDPFQYLPTPDGTPAGVQLIKQLLNNGELIGFATGDPDTDFSYTTIKSCTTTTCNPNGYTVDNTLSGQQAIYMADANIAHEMTIVGYDDNVWVDVNGNGVVDQGEMGAFKIANQWGTGVGNHGFYWIAYDALNTFSAVINGPNAGRGPIIQYPAFLSVRTNPDGSQYTPQVVGQFNVSDAQRDQLFMSLGLAAATTPIQSAPASIFYPSFAMAGGGGPISFSGTAVLDFTDILSPGSNTFYLGMTSVDATGKVPATLSSFSLTDPTGNVLGTANSTQLTADGNETPVYSTINYDYSGNLKLDLQQSIGGTITVSPKTATVAIGSNAVFTITPAAGYYLYSIGDNNQQILATKLGYSNGVYTYNLNDITANHTVAPYFAPIIDYISAGSGFTAAVGSANLSGEIIDNSGATPTVSWQQVYGPGTATFGTPTSVTRDGATTLFFANTTVQFPSNGIYMLQLTATDGTASQSSNVLVTVTNLAITTQPLSQTSYVGQTATFSVVASGTATLTYQWYQNISKISGATSASYTTPVLATSNSGQIYTVTVSNASGSLTSNGAILTVSPALVAPNITTQPANQSVYAGQTATFNVAATGGALHYQWYLGSSMISGATSASYTTPALTVANSGQLYSVAVSNTVGGVISAAATLTVNPAPAAPVITTQPMSQTVNAGQTATFSVVATGIGLSYQWQINGVNVSNPNVGSASSYTTSVLNSTNNGEIFTVIVSNAGGSVTSSQATLTVNSASQAPSITSQPRSETVTAPGPASFSVTANGVPAPTFQLEQSTDGGVTFNNYGQPITASSTAATVTYSFTVSTANNGNEFRFLVSNGIAPAATSTVATLTVNPTPVAPSITTQPVSVTVIAPATATFTAAATGVPAPAYQWERSTNGTTWTSISGATSASYTTPATTVSEAGTEYELVATNAFGSATSSVATLNVNSGPNSPDGTTLSPGSTGSLITASGTWKYASGDVILLNGKNVAGGVANLLLVYNQGKLYAEYSGVWYLWNGSGWNTLSGDPRIPLTPDGTTLSPGSSGSLVTTSGTWTFESGDVILLNGKNVPGGVANQLLVYNQGQLYAEYNGIWYLWNGSGWNTLSGDPRGAVTETITASAGTNGSISPSGSVSVNYGANQTFTVTPSAGYSAILTVDGAAATLTNNMYTFSDVITPHTIAVIFSVITITPDGTTLSPGSAGSLVSTSGTWTFGSGDVILLNGNHVTGGTANLLLIYNQGKLYAEYSGIWYLWNGSGWNTLGGDPRTPHTPDGTTLSPGSAGSLVSTSGTWTFGGGDVILLNGKSVAGGVANLLLIYNQGQLYAEYNSIWYLWNGSGWSTLGSDPRTPLTPDGTTLSPGSSGSLVSASGTWTFGSGDVILLNGGHVAGGTANLLLVYNQGQLYAEYNSIWYLWNGSGWNTLSGDPRSAQAGAFTTSNSVKSPITITIIKATKLK